MARKKQQQQQKERRLRFLRQTRRQPIHSGLMTDVEPFSANQKHASLSPGKEGKHLFIYGCAGTKTFCALYNALKDTICDNPKYESVYVVRSLVATREIGFLPGTHEDKADIYQIPYKNMVKYMFELGSDAEFESLYSGLKKQDTVKFWSTSFLRGVTLDNSVIIIDEMQNLNFHELDSIITRVGENSRIVFAGDAMQSDLIKDRERNGIHDFMRILRICPKTLI